MKESVDENCAFLFFCQFFLAVFTNNTDSNIINLVPVLKDLSVSLRTTTGSNSARISLQNDLVMTSFSKLTLGQGVLPMRH